MGYLAYRSVRFPQALSVLLVVCGACYNVDTLTLLLAPDFGKAIHAFLIIPFTIAEICVVGYLLVTGVTSVKSDKTVKPDARVPAEV